MNKYVCTVCGFIYDEAEGYTDEGIEAGTLFLIQFFSSWLTTFGIDWYWLASNTKSILSYS